MREFYRPSIQEFPDEVVDARDARSDPASRFPIPWGWSFGLSRSNLLIEPAAADYALFKKAYGFVANIHESSSGDTPSTFQATAVLKLPFRYGAKQAEFKTSWAFARTNAFSAKAGFPHKMNFVKHFSESVIFARNFFSRSFETLSIGDAVTGVIKITGGDYKTAHLEAWKPCSYTEWRRGSVKIFRQRSVV